jgi:hypothetical protein
MSTPVDDLFDTVMGRVGQSIPLQPVELDPEIARPKSFLKVLDATHYNWQADRFRKLFAMRFKVKVPPLDQINAIFYPAASYDFPIFIFFCLLTKRKVISHLNVNCPFDDSAYRAKWVSPLVALLDKYPSLDSADRYPDWMKKYRNECTIYGMFMQHRFDDLKSCAMDYLGYYLDQVMQATPTENPERLVQMQDFQDQFVDDIRTQDKAQGMISKMIGKEKARRIFYEITT